MTKKRKCKTCGKPIEIQPRSGLDPALYVDPYCSRTCCEKDHGLES